MLIAWSTVIIFFWGTLFYYYGCDMPVYIFFECIEFLSTWDKIDISRLVHTNFSENILRIKYQSYPK